MNVKLAHYLLGILSHLAPVDEQEPTGRFAPQEKIRGNVPAVDQRQVLEDGRNSQLVCPMGIADPLLSAVDGDLPSVWLVYPAENFRQGGFAGSVVANDS